MTKTVIFGWNSKIFHRGGVDFKCNSPLCQTLHCKWHVNHILHSDRVVTPISYDPTRYILRMTLSLKKQRVSYFGRDTVIG